MNEKIYPREKYLSKIRPFYDSDIVKVITGIRRCKLDLIVLLIFIGVNILYVLFCLFLCVKLKEDVS